MSPHLIAALAGFAFVGTITPGPNNLMLMASGANFGLRRTLPHMAGVAFGFAFMVAAMGLGVGQVFDRWPTVRTVLTVASIAYLLWLAWKIGSAAPKAPDAPETAGRPLTFLQAAGFQWVNPKAWAMALTAVTVYAPDRTVLTSIVVAAVVASMGLPSVLCWTVLGGQLRRWMTSPRRLRAFNWTMAAVLVATLWPILAL